MFEIENKHKEYLENNFNHMGQFITDLVNENVHLRQMAKYMSSISPN